MSDVPNTITGVDDESTVRKIIEFMSKVVDAFDDRSGEQILQLSHDGQDPADASRSLDFVQGLMDNGDTVKSWAAKKYSEPKWEIFQYSKFHPEPTVWIDVVLNDGDRDYPYHFALSLSENGELRRCYYVTR